MPTLMGECDRFHPIFRAYTYRDYVIEAFHQDLPYDRFIMEQLAADSLGLPNQDQPWRLWVF